MCATESGLKAERLYGPTKRAQMVGPVGSCSLQCKLKRGTDQATIGAQAASVDDGGALASDEAYDVANFLWMDQTLNE